MTRGLLFLVLSALSFLAHADNPNAPLAPVAPDPASAPAAPQPAESDLTSHGHYVNHAGEGVHSPSTTKSDAVPVK